MESEECSLATLGEALRTARQIRRLSLNQVESVTKIRLKYLVALEEDNLADLPPPVYTRGYVRAYATYLGLDPKQMLLLYEQLHPPAEPLGVQREVRPLRAPGAITGPQLLGIAVVAVLVLAGYYLYQQYTLFVASGLPQQAEGRAMGPRIGPTPASALAADPTIEAKATATPVPTPPPTPTATPIPGVHVVANVTQRSWLCVVVDNKRVYWDFVRPGATLKWDGNDQIFMRAGNAGGLEVSFNGKPQGALGAQGEVKNVEWTTTREGQPNTAAPGERWDALNKLCSQ
jgi:cytoskeletal protein RodZ